MLRTDEITPFLARQPHIVQPLATVAALGIEDCWIGAGLIRNAVWDHLHGSPAGPVPGSDVDVVYYNPANLNPAADLLLQQQLLAAAPDIPWSAADRTAS